jgi:hypothetical protein
MATYESLTTEQKAILASYDSFLRSIFVALARVFRDSNALIQNQFYTANVAPILASLDAGEMIPNSTGLANAQPLSVAQFNTLQAIGQGLLTEYESNIPLLVQTIGTNL